MGDRTYTQLWFAAGESAGGDAVSGRGAFTRRHVSIQYSPPGDSEQPALTVSHLPLDAAGLDVPALKVEAGEFSQGDAVLIEKLGTRTFTGTWTFTNGSATVNAGGADGNALAEIAVGDSIRQSDGTQWYQVTAVPDDDNITISPVFQQATHTDEADASLYKSDATGAFLTGQSDGVDLFSFENDGDIWNLGTMYAHQANVGGIVAAVDGTTPLDMTLGNEFTCTPAENTSWSTSAPTNGIGGQLASFVVDNSGGYTVAWASGFTNVDSIAASDTGVHTRLLQFDGTTWHQIAATEDGEATNVTGGGGGVFREVALNNLFGPSTAGANYINGDNNVAAGAGALDHLNGSSFDAYGNVGVGVNAGHNITSGTGNLMFGLNTGNSITIGDYNIAFGEETLQAEVGGDGNIAIGHLAMNTALGALYNIAIGEGAFGGQTPVPEGYGNVILGPWAGVNLEGDSNRNIIIGELAGPASDVVVDDKIWIGNNDHNLIYGDLAAKEWGIDGYLQLYEQPADAPLGVADGAHVWVSDGTGTGDEGDGYVTVHTAGNPGADVTFKLWDAITGAAASSPFREVATYNIFGPSTAGRDAATGDYNFAAGHEAGDALTSGFRNVLIGWQAGTDLTEGNMNVFLGYWAGANETTGDDNIGIGNSSLGLAVGADDNIALGPNSMGGCIDGLGNIALGPGAMLGDSSTSNPQQNIGIGASTLLDITSGAVNLALGHRSATNVTTADDTIALGRDALFSITTGDGNIGMGFDAGAGFNGDSDKCISIGYESGPVTGATYSEELFIDTHTDDTPLIHADFSAHTVDIYGELDATTKTFRITHPLDDSKELFHGVVESPEFGLRYRGRAVLVDGSVTVNIDESCNMSPGTFKAIAQNTTVQVQNMTGFTPVKPTEIVGAEFTIETSSVDSGDTVNWVVYAERCDGFIMESVRTDSEGCLILEVPRKNRDGTFMTLEEAQEGIRRKGELHRTRHENRDMTERDSMIARKIMNRKRLRGDSDESEAA